MSEKKDVSYEAVVKRLREKYHAVHPLVFARCTERAKGPGEAFDILESLPKSLPMIWSAEQRKFVETDDLTQSREFQAPVSE